MPSPADYLEGLFNPLTSSEVFYKEIGESTISFLGEDGTLESTLEYTDRSKQHVFVAVDYSSDYPNWRQYSFNYVDAGNGLIFRYDNQPHHHDLPFYPHHKHLGPNDRIVGCPLPSVARIKQEIGNSILQRRV